MRGVGSGLILLVIVGAWLAVLVPLGLRSSGGPGSLLPAAPREPLGAGEPGRVLSRRARAVPRPAADPEPDPEPERAAEPDPVPVVRASGPRRDAAPAGVAARRRRVLTLLALLVVTVVVAALAGPAVLVPVAVGLAVLLALLVVHLRRSAVRRRVQARAERRAREAALRLERFEEQERRRQEAEELALEQEFARLRRQVAGIPSRMPPRPAPPVVPEEQQVPLRQAAGAEWQPRPVPLPMYVRHAADRAARVPAQPAGPPAVAPEPAPYEHRWVAGGW